MFIVIPVEVIIDGIFTVAVGGDSGRIPLGVLSLVGVGAENLTISANLCLAIGFVGSSVIV